jgi:hypothetical protein
MTGVIIECSRRPNRNQARLSGASTRGNRIAVARNTIASSSAHRREEWPRSNGMQPMIAKSAAKTNPKDRSEPRTTSRRDTTCSFAATFSPHPTAPTSVGFHFVSKRCQCRQIAPNTPDSDRRFKSQWFSWIPLPLSSLFSCVGVAEM